MFYKGFYGVAVRTVYLYIKEICLLLVQVSPFAKNSCLVRTQEPTPF